MNPNMPDDDKLVITEGDFPPRTNVLVVDYILNLQKRLRAANKLVEEARFEIIGLSHQKSEDTRTLELLDRMDAFLGTMKTPHLPVWKEGVTPPNSTLQ